MPLFRHFQYTWVFTGNGYCGYIWIVPHYTTFFYFQPFTCATPIENPILLMNRRTVNLYRGELLAEIKNYMLPSKTQHINGYIRCHMYRNKEHEEMWTLDSTYSQCLAFLLDKNCRCAMLTSNSEVHMIVSVFLTHAHPNGSGRDAGPYSVFFY